MTPSKYQQGVFDFIRLGSGHGRVKALAGSGKTTTARLSLNLIPMDDTVLFVAFNKLIADELKKNIPMNVQAMTLHSFGFQALKKAIRAPRVDQYKVGNILQTQFDMDSNKERGEYYAIRNAISRIVSLCKGQLIHEPTDDDIVELIGYYDLDIKKAKIDRVIMLAKMMLSASRNQKGIIDFDDMIYLPIYLNVPIPDFKWVFVDELQDLNDANAELVYRAGDGGRIIGIGDPRQSIYGFRGANVAAMDRFKDRLSATDLPLNICYRCSVNVIKEAQKIVPEIEWCEGAPEGAVGDIKKDDFEKKVVDGNFVLCRTTAPLVSSCLKFIREGRKAVVRGRDIGQGLVRLCEQIDALGSGDDWFIKMGVHRQQEMEKLSRSQNKEDEIIALNDRYDTLDALYHGMDADLGGFSSIVQRISRKIEQIFSDDIAGIVFSTVHRSKGLESDSVFILEPQLLPHPRATQDWQREQELNLKYVAITRAKKELYYVR